MTTIRYLFVFFLWSLLHIDMTPTELWLHVTSKYLRILMLFTYVWLLMCDVAKNVDFLFCIIANILPNFDFFFVANIHEILGNFFKT